MAQSDPTKCVDGYDDLTMWRASAANNSRALGPTDIHAEENVDTDDTGGVDV
ncbi:hypothetical protein [Halobacterium salinarum]|uniref:hypothetical protein n=1 Tax=Halobacterium salinarum TaxID=2242 RepID=UPI001F421276|nr:hypothetical protein [Halobacterium salinarum]MCF2165433.1 hypothetical protein [Halobacterium salinarum]MCF2168298.1 hypothetical protein [Halobacterium salinarum]